jgi:small GTP-binding protein
MTSKKIALLGMWGVGKTSLVQQFVHSIYDEKYQSTLGVKVDQKIVTIDGEDIKLMLWDIAGAEETFSVPASYIRGASGYLLVIDGTRAQSLRCAMELISDIEEQIPGLPFIPVVNKSDLEWEITDEEISTAFEPFNTDIIRSSAKTGENVNIAFLSLARKLL